MDAMPEGFRVEQLMPAGEVQGARVQVQRLRVSLPAPEAAAALEAQWRHRGHPVVTARSGEWWLVSVREGAVIRTAQFRTIPQGSEGIETRWARSEQTQVTAPEWGPAIQALLPTGARVLRQTVHHDPARAAVTVVAVVPMSVVAAAQALRQQAARNGYAPDPAIGSVGRDAAWYRGRPDGSGEALAFRRADSEVVATVAPHDSGAALVMHWGQMR